MVGDDWQNDIEPAAALGMATFWIAPPGAEPPGVEPIAGYGSLDRFYDWWKQEGNARA
jgi:FMN phosphatase YigB (HAD superfamily)